MCQLSSVDLLALTMIKLRVSKYWPKIFSDNCLGVLSSTGELPVVFILLFNCLRQLFSSSSASRVLKQSRCRAKHVNRK